MLEGDVGLGTAAASWMQQDVNLWVVEAPENVYPSGRFRVKLWEIYCF